MISCQFSIYPLGVEDLGPAIEAALAELRSLDLAVEVGPMSTYFVGDANLVFAGLSRAFEVAAREGLVIMNVTLSNACPLPED